LRGGYVKDEVTVDLPAFALPGIAGYRGGGTVDMHAPRRPAITISEKETREAAKAWTALAERCREDPRAAPELDTPSCT
jgi:hypothetical protein